MIYDQPGKASRDEEEGANQFIEKARRLATDHFNDSLDIVKGQNKRLHKEDFYVVWFVKVLQNWKALVSTDKVNGLYYEITYNGDNLEAYVNAYVKATNTAIPDSE